MSSRPAEPHAKRRIRLIAPILLVTVMALAVWLVATVWASYNPTASIEVENLDPGEPADVTSNFTIPTGDVNFDAVVTYTPPEWGVAADADVPDGTLVGSLHTNPTLGLTFTPCQFATLIVDFDMLDASTDTSDTFASTGVIDDGSWSGFDPGPGGNDMFVDRYPDWLAGLYPEPHARYAGKVFVGAGFNLWVIVQFLVFEPGTNIGAGIPDDAEWGYPSVTVLNNPTQDPDPTSALGDFCSRLISNNTVFGESEGYEIRTNPECAGTYTFRNWSRGQPDADGDGYENAFDTCPYDADPPSEDPRATRGADNDAIMASCDPDPTGVCWPAAANPMNSEECDGDGFANNADNCPLIPNDDQTDSDDDGIGDDCDEDGVASKPTKLTEEEVEIDTDSPECEAEGTPTPTGTVVGTVTPTPTPAPGEETAVPTATPPPGPEGICSFSFPATYNGLARLNGVPATGYVVTVEVGGEPWGSAVIEAGRYDVDVPDHPPATPPCFPPEAGTALAFKINGATCTTTPETTAWQSGLHEVDINCAAAATATPAPGTPAPGTPAPGTPAPGTPKPTVTPAKPPPSGGGGFGGDQDLPLWAIVLAGWAGLTALAGLGTLATRIAKR